MISSRRNIMWPLVIMIVGGIWLLAVADTFSDAVDDLLARAWPALLILFGFDVLFGRRRLRIRRWQVEMSVAGVPVVAALVLAVVWLAYQKQSDIVRADNVVTFAEGLDEVTHLEIAAALGRTAVTVNASDTGDIVAEFKGSNESVVEMQWSAQGTRGILNITETQPNAIPRLEDYGRGTLAISLPKDAFIDQFVLENRQGDVTIDADLIHLTQLRLVAEQGNVTLNLPRLDTLDGEVTARAGNIEIVVPDERDLNVVRLPGSSAPRYAYDSLRYIVLQDGELRPANVTSFQYRVKVWVKSDTTVVITDID